MQDRFKFRVWDKKLNCILFADAGTNYFYMFQEDNFIVMQCTGLNDKNGRLIYEGDIVKIQILEDCEAFGTNEKYIDIKSSIIYENSGFFIEQSDNNIFLGQIPQSELEVIGNIYENQELLEEYNNG